MLSVYIYIYIYTYGSDLCFAQSPFLAVQIINEGVIDAVDEYLRDWEEVFYFEGISKLEQNWRKCIEAKGDYIEI